MNFIKDINIIVCSINKFEQLILDMVGYLVFIEGIVRMGQIYSILLYYEIFYEI